MCWSGILNICLTIFVESISRERWLKLHSMCEEIYVCGECAALISHQFCWTDPLRSLLYVNIINTETDEGHS